jgi:hypothetical protein
VNLIDALRCHIGHRITLTFADGGCEPDGLLTAVNADNTISVEREYEHGGIMIAYTACYTLTPGDDETPHVTGVTRMPAPQAEGLF